MNAKKITVGRGHVCVLDDLGVACWGDNRKGQFNVPKDLGVPLEIAVGHEHACAQTLQGVRCWGRKSSGELNVPVPF